MKKTKSFIYAALLTVLFPFFCVSSSFDPHIGKRFFGYFGPHSFTYSLIRCIIIILLVLLLCYLNRNNKNVFTKYVPVSFLSVHILIIVDYFFTRHILYNYTYCLWIGVSVCIAFFALFIGATLFLKEGYKEFYIIIWRLFLPIYIFIIFIAFIRLPDSYSLTVNTKIGNGTLKYFSYILHNPEDSYMLMNCIGNIFIFSPFAFIIKGINIKTPYIIIIIIGVITPFAVEAYQYILRCGNVDIDDLILNLTGFILGFILLKIIYDKKLKEAA